MKQIKYIVLMLLMPFIVIACPVCEKNQPDILKGITHGAGPQSNWDFVMIGVSVIIVLFSLLHMVYKILCPGEKNANHIKNSIIK